MKEDYYIGNLRKDSLEGKNKGWVVGNFMDAGARQTDKLEVKYWEFKKGETGHTEKISTTTEFTFVMEGEVAGTIDDREITLNKGEYIFIKPGVKNNIAKRALLDVKGITIKAPSDPAAKHVVE